MNIPFLKSNAKDDVNEFVMKVLMLEAHDAELERRKEGRVPFFQPALITLENSEESGAAFTRDIAPDGIGLLHAYPIPPQEVKIDLNVADGGQIRLEVGIHWCVSCGDGWYISGGIIRNGNVVK